MAAIRKFQQFSARDLFGDDADLAQGGVFVVFALYGEHREADFWEGVFDVPVTKIFGQP